MKYLFAVNPVSGKNKAIKKMTELAIILRDNGYDFIIYETKPTKYRIELKQLIIDEQITHVYAVGGDGTAHEVLNAVVGLDVFFGIIPFGSGNDFARVLHLPQNIDKVFDMIKKNDHVSIDVGEINDCYFLNYISFGIDVDIVKQSLKFKKIFHSSLAYIFALVTTLITYKCKKIKINDKEDRLYLATIHNGNFYGGGMKINPFAEINDGILDLCTVKKMNRFKLLALFPSVFSGKHFKFKKLVHFENKSNFVIDADYEQISAGIDGETYELQLPIEINILPKKVKMIRY